MQYDDAKNEVEAEPLDSENGSARGEDSDSERESVRDDDFERSESYSENCLNDDEADPFADLSENSNTKFEDSSDDEAARETVKKYAIDRLQIPNVISTQTSIPCQDIVYDHDHFRGQAFDSLDAAYAVLDAACRAR
ncbi:hypothetical protein PsorP6_016573 [Peronosclerospora sorghi]|uniref:Uncharacterized protein n=1 Tax=Peronosclerospora sorghi TaxID=230839 RepID=A0ACC0VNG4_9STRA|nr:hypothetical protein PsorP6_016573 [Peronosclerospora sorghi]